MLPKAKFEEPEGSHQILSENKKRKDNYITNEKKDDSKCNSSYKSKYEQFSSEIILFAAQKGDLDSIDFIKSRFGWSETYSSIVIISGNMTSIKHIINGDFPFDGKLAVQIAVARNNLPLVRQLYWHHIKDLLEKRKSKLVFDASLIEVIGRYGDEEMCNFICSITPMICIK
jgi:hypothetical protein